MHDTFLKSVFADRRMVEILVRRHAPEWASEIDFSTLREEPSGLVSRKTHQRRHPDMIWSAAAGKGRRVLFLLEFQRTVEPLMARARPRTPRLRSRESPPDPTSGSATGCRSSSISSSTTAMVAGPRRTA